MLKYNAAKGIMLSMYKHKMHAKYNVSQNYSLSVKIATLRTSIRPVKWPESRLHSGGLKFRVAFNVGSLWSVSRGNGRIERIGWITSCWKSIQAVANEMGLVDISISGISTPTVHWLLLRQLFRKFCGSKRKNRDPSLWWGRGEGWFVHCFHPFIYLRKTLLDNGKPKPRLAGLCISAWNVWNACILR